MKSGRRAIPWASLLATIVTIASGLTICGFVVLVYSKNPKRDTVLLALVFLSIIWIPVAMMRPPRDPREKRRWFRWLRFWRRWKRRGDAKDRKTWKRKRGQTSHQPFGTRPISPASTFVRTKRRRSESQDE